MSNCSTNSEAVGYSMEWLCGQHLETFHNIEASGDVIGIKQVYT